MLTIAYLYPETTTQPKTKRLTKRQGLHARSLVSLAYAKEILKKAAEKKFDKIKMAESTNPCLTK